MDSQHDFLNLTNLEREVEEENASTHARRLMDISAQAYCPGEEKTY